MTIPSCSWNAIVRPLLDHFAGGVAGEHVDALRRVEIQTHDLLGVVPNLIRGVHLAAFRQRKLRGLRNQAFRRRLCAQSAHFDRSKHVGEEPGKNGGHTIRALL